jgi:hypothetical protein
MRQLRKVDASSSLERAIDGEMTTLNGVSFLMGWPRMDPVTLWYCDGCGISSRPNVGIVMDMKQIKTIQKASGLNDKRMLAVISFLLAHEYVHQVQYKVYGTSILSSSLSERRVYEAQADLMASVFVLQTVTLFRDPMTAKLVKDLKLGDSLPFDNVTQLYEDWVNVAFLQGAEQFSLSDHPSRAARASAARLGLGAMWGFKILAVKDRPVDWNVRDGEKQLPWSLRTARLLCNDNQDAITELIQKSINVDWGNRTDGKVGYSVTYENAGSRPLDVSLVIECVEVPKGPGRANVAKWSSSGMAEHTFSLAAHASTTVEGQLNWSRSSDATIPQFNLPGEVGGIVSVAYSDAKDAPAAAAGPTVGFAYAKPQDEDFDFALQTLLEHPMRFLDLRSGPGHRQDDGVTYPTDPQLPGSNTTMVYKLDTYNYASRVVASFDATLYDYVLSRVQKDLGEQGGWMKGPLPGKDEDISGARFKKQTLNVDVVKTSDSVLLVLELDLPFDKDDGPPAVVRPAAAGEDGACANRKEVTCAEVDFPDAANVELSWRVDDGGDGSYVIYSLGEDGDGHINMTKAALRTSISTARAGHVVLPNTARCVGLLLTYRDLANKRTSYETDDCRR